MLHLVFILCIIMVALVVGAMTFHPESFITFLRRLFHDENYDSPVIKKLQPVSDATTQTKISPRDFETDLKDKASAGGNKDSGENATTSKHPSNEYAEIVRKANQKILQSASQGSQQVNVTAKRAHDLMNKVARNAISKVCDTAKNNNLSAQETNQLLEKIFKEANDYMITIEAKAFNNIASTAQKTRHTISTAVQNANAQLKGDGAAVDDTIDLLGSEENLISTSLSSVSMKVEEKPKDQPKPLIQPPGKAIEVAKDQPKPLIQPTGKGLEVAKDKPKELSNQPPGKKADTPSPKLSPIIKNRASQPTDPVEVAKVQSLKELSKESPGEKAESTPSAKLSPIIKDGNSQPAEPGTSIPPPVQTKPSVNTQDDRLEPTSVKPASEVQSVEYPDKNPRDDINVFKGDLKVSSFTWVQSSSAVKIWPHVSCAEPSFVDGHPRRMRIPDKPTQSASLWGILKNCIGKDLSKIPFPVNFNEPLSLMQRIAEDYEYSNLLDRAASHSDPALQIAYVAAFTVTNYSTSADRLQKPFTCLLGETYECDRTADLGWRMISEKVIHNPPTYAVYVEGCSGWRMWTHFSFISRFRGVYISVTPETSCHVVFNNTGNHYCYGKVTTTIHNLIVGKLWLENHGEAPVEGLEGACTGYVALCNFYQDAYFGKEKDRHKVEITVKDPEGVPKFTLTGQWSSSLSMAPADGKAKATVVWERVPAPPGAEKWYGFTLLAAQLNEPEQGVAPTDSRCRPDQRLMEEGKWDEANKEKDRIEQKQRVKRKNLEMATAEALAKNLPPPQGPQPLWFSKVNGVFMYTHKYWDCKKRQDWAQCPDIM